MPALTSQGRTFAVQGMTCAACASRVEAALHSVPGVSQARVDLGSAQAVVEFEPSPTIIGALTEAVRAAGYELAEPGTGGQAARHRFWLPVVSGLLAAVALLAFYLVVISVAQGWEHALAQLVQDRWFVGPILIGFGTQVGLFSYLRGVSARASSSVAMTATSTGMSTGAMLACCAHHLVDVLPVLGLSGAALFLAEYQRPLFVLAIAMNLVGIVYMLRLTRRGFGVYQKESTT